jgi:hypothetical protein
LITHEEGLIMKKVLASLVLAGFLATVVGCAEEAKKAPPAAPKGDSAKGAATPPADGKK